MERLSNSLIPWNIISLALCRSCDIAPGQVFQYVAPTFPCLFVMEFSVDIIAPFLGGSRVPMLWSKISLPSWPLGVVSVVTLHCWDDNKSIQCPVTQHIYLDLDDCKLKNSRWNCILHEMFHLFVSLMFLAWVPIRKMPGFKPKTDELQYFNHTHAIQMLVMEVLVVKASVVGVSVVDVSMMEADLVLDQSSSLPIWRFVLLKVLMGVGVSVSHLVFAHTHNPTMDLTDHNCCHPPWVKLVLPLHQWWSPHHWDTWWELVGHWGVKTCYLCWWSPGQLGRWEVVDAMLYVMLK